MRSRDPSYIEYHLTVENVLVHQENTQIRNQVRDEKKVDGTYMGNENIPHIQENRRRMGIVIDSIS